MMASSIRQGLHCLINYKDSGLPWDRVTIDRQLTLPYDPIYRYMALLLCHLKFHHSDLDAAPKLDLRGASHSPNSVGQDVTLPANYWRGQVERYEWFCVPRRYNWYICNNASGISTTYGSEMEKRFNILDILELNLLPILTFHWTNASEMTEDSVRSSSRLSASWELRFPTPNAFAKENNIFSLRREITLRISSAYGKARAKLIAGERKFFSSKNETIRGWWRGRPLHLSLRNNSLDEWILHSM